MSDPMRLPRGDFAAAAPPIDADWQQRVRTRLVAAAEAASRGIPFEWDQLPTTGQHEAWRLPVSYRDAGMSTKVETLADGTWLFDGKPWRPSRWRRWLFRIRGRRS